MSLTRIGLATQQVIASVSSAEKTFLQKEYEKFFRGLLAEYEVESPFDLPTNEQLDLFNDASKRWKLRKSDLLEEGKIDASQV